MPTIPSFLPQSLREADKADVVGKMRGEVMAMLRRGTDYLVKDMKALQDDFAPHQNETQFKEAETFQTMGKFQKMARLETHRDVRATAADLKLEISSLIHQGINEQLKLPEKPTIT